MESKLPRGWVKAPLNEVVTSRKGKKPKSIVTEKKQGYVPYILIDELEGLPPRAYTNDLKVPCATKNDVLLVWDGSIGKCNSGLEGAVGSTMVVITPKGIETKYLDCFIKHSKNFILSSSTGSGLQHINKDFFNMREIPIAPIREQKRIVAKLEKLLARVNDAKGRLETISRILKRFRQSVLAAACSGRLTADWRLTNPDLESAEILLARIKEKRMLLAQTTKEKNQIIEAFQPDSMVLEEDELKISEIPETWRVCRIGVIGTVVNGSTPSRKQSGFWGGNISWVSSGEVRNNVITATEETITQSGYDNCSVRLLPKGTVLLAMIGEGKTRGQAAILAIEATINQNIAAVLLNHGLVSSEFLWWWFQLQYEGTRERGSGSGPQALNCQRVRELPFVLPPLLEQKEIVCRIEKLFKLADTIETRYAKAKAFVDKLTQSILAKAFRGELVPQDPNDEPASALLERILAKKTFEVNLIKKNIGAPKILKFKRRLVMSDLKSRKTLFDALCEVEKALAPEELFHQAGFEEATVEEFYDELRREVEAGRITEKRLGHKEVRLESVSKKTK